MLAELGASHTHYYTPEDPAYYQLADIFVGALEHRGLDRVFPKGEVAYPGIGAFTEADSQGRTFVSGAIEGAPAHEAGVLVGDEILSVGRSSVPPGRLLSRQGRGSCLASGPPRARRGAVRNQRNAGRSSSRTMMFLRGLKASARVIVAGDKTRIGYVRVWSYASRRYQSALEDLIGEGPLKDADALIWDLRGGWGGAQPQYLDLFNPRAPTMQVKDRNGETGLVGGQMAQARRDADQSGHPQRQGGAGLRVQGIPARRT